MQALRLARIAARPVAARRCLTTATANHAEVASSSSSAPTATSSRVAPVPLSNLEALWTKLDSEEKLAVHEQLEALQLKDWKALSMDEKKAAYYVAFGPHGPRAPTSAPGEGFKILLATAGLISLAGALFYVVQSLGAPPPKTLTKEWQEASNERAKEMNLNPISGISSEGYSGKGFVQAKK
ncbi:COX4-domain-containing protein [Phlegmacium glaucopus]|nr:COX4-domain-containing protein [Phlegmacium glaucopus]